MSWLTPWTGFILAASTVPLLLLLYFLKLRRSTQRISSTMLWVRSTEDLRANAPFQRLRRNILLLLQLLALIMLILAVMQPRIEGAGGGGGRTILLIDRSGSMATRDVDGGGTRLAAAIEAAGTEIDRLHTGGLFSSGQDETMIVAFAETAEVVQPFTSSRQQLLDALEGIELTHGRSHLEDALNLARVYSTNPDPEQVNRPIADPASLVLFSDGRIQDLEGLVLRGETLVFQRIGTQEVDNVSVAHVAAERAYDRPAFIEVFSALANWNPEDVVADVQLSVNGIPRRVEEVELPAAVRDATTGTLLAGRRNLSFTPFEQERDALIEVTVLREDQLPEDDTGLMVVPPPRQLRVGLVTPGRLLIRRTLEGLALERLEVMTPGAYASAMAERGPGAWDVLVFDAVVPETMPGVPSAFLGRTPPTDRLREYGESGGQVILGNRGDHPIARYVNVDSLYIDRARLVQPAEDVVVVFEGSEGPVVYTFVDDGQEYVYTTFDPIADTNWPYQHGLGVFLFNVVEYLGHQGDALTRQQRRPGQALVVHLPRDAEDVRLKTPDGKTIELIGQDPSRTTWGPVELSGLYEVTYQRPGMDERGSWFESVRMPVEAESESNAADEISLGRETIISTDAGTLRYQPLWPWAVAMCLVILLIEWWIYNRKIGSW